MKKFLDETFLLETDVARHLYETYGKSMPIIDYHCHIDPKEIAVDQRFENITQIWLGGDHYKWRLMRAAGVDEFYITGEASDYEKFEKWSYTLEQCIGNPLYHWSHMELKTYFGYEGILNHTTAPDVWNLCNEKLKNMSARQIIKQSGVTVICTTDDPLSSLQWHKQIAESDFDVTVLPSWRPDKIFSIGTPDFCSFVEQLSQCSGVSISDYPTFKEALAKRIAFFHEMGCRISDHSFSEINYTSFEENEISAIMNLSLNGKPITDTQKAKFQTACLMFMSQKYCELNWSMQLHYGVLRNNNTNAFCSLGVDTGFDSIGDNTKISQLGQFFNALTQNHCLPKTIVYSLNPNDNAAIDVMIGCFQDGTVAGKIQHGAAWWFNDHKQGINSHLTSLASLGCLGNFIGMLTDSRSFLSYTRHDYFRRILCNFIGNLVVNGEYPNDEETLGRIIQNICHNNAQEYFNFPVQ